MASDEVNELARTVTELMALVETQRVEALDRSRALERLTGSLSQVAMLIEDLQERVSCLEEQVTS